MLRYLILASGLTLATACSGPEPTRFAAPEPATQEKVRVAYGSISVREVSLPIHAASEEISISDASGAVNGAVGPLWADDPVRAVTLGLTQALSEITRARVAPDPWPFESFPDVSIDVRISELLPMEDGTYVARGMAFVAPGADKGRERSVPFDLSVPYDIEGGVPAIAAARSVLISDLALLIAKSGLR